MASVMVDLVKNQLAVRIAQGSTEFQSIVNVVKDVAANGGGQYNGKAKAWMFGLSQYPALMESLARYTPQVMPAVHTWQLEQAKLKSMAVDLPEVEGRTYGEHQKLGVTWVVQNANAMLLDDQGLGKTMQACVAARIRHESGAVTKTLIICPNSVKAVWMEEFKVCAPDLKVQTLKAKKGVDPWADVVVINFESVRRRIDELLGWAPEFVIIDEVHRMKNRRTKTFEAIVQLNPRFRLSMSGTMVANRPEDCWAPVNWTVPGYFPDYYGWLRSFCLISNRFGHMSIDGYKNLDALKDRIRRISLRRTKDEVLDLPDRLYQRRQVSMNPYQRALYEQCRQDLLQTLNADGFIVTPNALTRTMRLAQIASNPRLMGPEYQEVTTKYDEALALISDSDRPVIVWSCYRYDLYRMAEILFEEGILFVTVHGLVPHADRVEAIRRFQEGGVKVFLGSPAAAREGITLTAADSMIYINRSFNAVDRLQSLDRNYRIGQHRTCTVYDLVVPDTIDQLTYEAVQGKAAMNNWVQSQSTDQELAVEPAELQKYLERVTRKGD